jgi:cytidylate kinase
MVAPLEPALDAEVLDTTRLDVAEVCNWALELAAKRFRFVVPEIR